MKKVPNKTGRSIQPFVSFKSTRNPGNDFAYWQSQPYPFRLAALEEIRTEYNQWRYGAKLKSKEFIQSLNDNNVRYLVVGGYAVALHGYPRYTKGMDIWIERTPENAKLIVKALDKFGFASLGLKDSDFLVEDQIIQLGYPPNRIDIITSLMGVKFLNVMTCGYN